MGKYKSFRSKFDSLASLVASEGRESRSRLDLETKGTETLGLVLNL